jgi:hypothetical protein
MLNTTPAAAEATTAQTAVAYAAQAVTPPLVGFGAGAFPCAGARGGSVAADVKGTTAIGMGQARAGAFGAAYKTSVVDIVQVDSVQLDTHNFIQMARLFPATRGGMGPHPAREPEPV